MPNFYCLWVSTLAPVELRRKKVVTPTFIGHWQLRRRGCNVRGFLFLPRFEMETMGNMEVANYVSRDSMRSWECFKWTFSHSSHCHPPWLISKLFPIICPLPVWFADLLGRRYLNIFPGIFKYFHNLSPVAWSAMNVMMEPMMKRASTILNLSISAIFDENQMFSR